MKDKILCALKSNVLSLKKQGENYSFYSKNTCIEMSSKEVYAQTLVTEYTTTWWGKVRESEHTKNTRIGVRYYVKAYNKEYDITKKEYQEVITYRNSKIEINQEKELDSLCKD